MRWLEHDADILLEVEAPSAERLFALAAEALVEAMLDEGAAVAEREHRRVRLRADGREVLLVAWLNEIIYLVCDGVFLPASVRLTELTGSSLEAMLAGETPDGSRHRLAREVKAATYHDLEVSETDGLWRGRVLFDV